MVVVRDRGRVDRGPAGLRVCVVAARRDRGRARGRLGFRMDVESGLVGGVRGRGHPGRAGRPDRDPAGQRRARLAVPQLQPTVRPDDRRVRPGRRRDAADRCDRVDALRRPAGPDLLAIHHHADRLRTAAGQGILVAQRAVARLGLGGADRTGDGPDRGPGPRHARRGPHRRGFGTVAAPERQRAQPGFAVSPARPVRASP